jgi:hypothetical protein
MANNERGEQAKQNFVEKAVGGMMGGRTTKGSQEPDIVIGQEYGRTPYSEEPLKYYEKKRGSRSTLNAPEYYAVTQGYLREWVCMGQCNLYIQVLRMPKLRQMMETYRHDVCEPNLTEMKNILDEGGYEPPAPFNAMRDAKSVDELGKIDTDAIDDRMIMVGHIFSVEGFMNRWNMGARHSHRAEVRDAFLRNYHRANRWHLAAIAMAEQMQLIEPQPEITV